MKHFLFQLIVFLGLIAISCYGVFSLADGSTDAFYVKFTTPKQNSLIIGSSRAAQGIQPSVINSVLENSKIYNYAFSRVHTPYGPSYLRSIKAKLIPESNNGIFFVSVNPWTIFSTTKNPNDSSNFKEKKSFISKVNKVNLNPNIEYLMKSYDKRYIEILINSMTPKKDIPIFVENDGWCRVLLQKSNKLPSIKQKEITIKSYVSQKLEYSGFSQIRYDYLKKTINFLKEHGNVYIIRLPVCDEMLKIENELYLNFDEKMIQLSETCNVRYLNLMPYRNNYTYTDGHHLDSVSANEVSRFIADRILKTNQF